MCSLLSEALHLNEHEAARWLNKEDIHSVNWLPADEILLPMIVNELDSVEKTPVELRDKDEMPPIIPSIPEPKSED